MVLGNWKRDQETSEPFNTTVPHLHVPCMRVAACARVSLWVASPPITWSTFVHFLPNMYYINCLQRRHLLRGLWLEWAVSWDETDSTRSCRSVWRAAETSSSSTWSESTGRDVRHSTGAGESVEGVCGWSLGVCKIIRRIRQPVRLVARHGG